MTDATSTRELADLGELANTYGLLPASPAWTQVEATITRLESGRRAATSAPQMAEDLRVLDRFRRALAQSLPDVALGVASAAVISRMMSAGNRDARLRASLSALAKALRLPQLRPSDVLARLRQVARELHGLGIPGSELLSPIAGDEVVPEPLPVARAAVVAAREAPTASDDILSSVESAAWSALFARITTWVTSGKIDAPHASEIVCLAAQRPPSTVLGVHLDDVTVREWSLVLLRATGSISEQTAFDGSYPPWLGAAAAAALGVQAAFGPRSDAFLEHWLSTRADRAGLGSPDPEALGRLRSRTGHGRVLFLISERGADSAAAAWRPADSVCTLQLTAGEAGAMLDSSFRAHLAERRLREFIVALEAQGTVQKIEDELQSLQRLFDGTGAHVVVVAAEHLPSRLGPIVLAPRSQEDVLDIAGIGRRSAR